MDSWRFSWCSRKASWILLHHLLGYCCSVRHRSPMLLLFACVLDHCPGRCPANSGGYLVLSFHFLKGPFEYSSTLKQCATCPSFPSRNSAWSFKLPSLRGVFGECGGQLVACDLPATALPRRCVKRTTTFCGDVHDALKWLSEATG